MRKLDELIQDIPLGLLLPDEGADQDKAIPDETAVFRRSRAKRSEEAPAVMRGGLPAAALAVVIAAAAAVVLAVAVDRNHSVRTDPGAQPSDTASETVISAAEVRDFSAAESDAVSGQKNSDAEVLYNAMQKYMQERPDSGIGNEELMFVRMNDFDGENGEIGIQLRLQEGRDFPGTACFQFGDGELLYAEYKSDLGLSSRVQIYPEYMGQQTINYIGRVDAETDQKISGLDFSSRVVIRRMTDEGSVEKQYADIAGLPWLMEWYRGFQTNSPEPLKDPAGNTIVLKNVPDDYEGYVSAYFWDGTEFVNVSTAVSDRETVTVNGMLYHGDVSVLDKLRQYIADTSEAAPPEG